MLESVLKRTMNLAKGLEQESSEEQLRKLDLAWRKGGREESFSFSTTPCEGAEAR